MTLGINGETCQSDGICTLEAEYCAALTDSHGELVSHKFLCEAHAQSMFAVTVNFGERLSRRVETLKRQKECPDMDVHRRGKTHGPDFYPDGKSPRS